MFKNDFRFSDDSFIKILVNKSKKIFSERLHQRREREKSPTGTSNFVAGRVNSAFDSGGFQGSVSIPA